MTENGGSATADDNTDRAEVIYEPATFMSQFFSIRLVFLITMCHVVAATVMPGDLTIICTWVISLIFSHPCLFFVHM